VDAWVSSIFCNFYLVKNHKLTESLATTKAREKMSAELETLKFWNIFDVCLTKL